MYFCTTLTLCVMYATQPLQPYFEEMLGISQFKASLFTTSILAPLSFASMFYGYFLEKTSIKKILIIAFFSFGVLEICFALSSSYFMLINIRGIQGLIAPAALTGIMSYISQTTPNDQVAGAIGAYIGITIIGGFLGRFLSGLFTDLFGWQFFFMMLGILLIIASLLLFRIKGNVSTSYIKPRLRDVATVFSKRYNFYVYFAIFGIFFVFQAILNFLPFELTSIGGEYSGSKTGIMYFGYAIGILISFNAARIIKFIGSAPKSIFLGTLIFFASLQLLRVENFMFMFFAMIVVCGGNFLAHSIATGYINKKAISYKAISNGLYVSFYYAGGALGSFVPGFFYGSGNWQIFLSVLSVFITVSLIFLWKLIRYDKSQILS